MYLQNGKACCLDRREREPLSTEERLSGTGSTILGRRPVRRRPRAMSPSRRKGYARALPRTWPWLRPRLSLLGVGGLDSARADLSLLRKGKPRRLPVLRFLHRSADQAAPPP